MKIITNHHWRNFLYGYELSEKERRGFDWLDEEGIDTGSFFRYRGNTYSLDEFMRSSMLPEWDGFHGDSFFSGIAIKLSEDGEQYKVALVLS
jgi:hypothetical protein